MRKLCGTRNLVADLLSVLAVLEASEVGSETLLTDLASALDAAAQEQRNLVAEHAALLARAARDEAAARTRALSDHKPRPT